MAYQGETLDPFLGASLPISGARTGEDGPEFGVLVSATSSTTTNATTNATTTTRTGDDRVEDWLSRRRPGDIVRLVGPLGRGFEPRPRVEHMLLVAHAKQVAGLTWLAEVLVQQGREVTMVVGGATEGDIYPPAALPAEVELSVVTEDGSLGATGTIVQEFERLLPWCDQAFVSAPDATLRDLYAVVRDRGTNKPMQALVRPPMACGTGVCEGCVLFPQRGGVRLVCTDGPVFELRDLYG